MKGREGEGREEKGREGKRREEKGREGNKEGILRICLSGDLHPLCLLFIQSGYWQKMNQETNKWNDVCLFLGTVLIS